MKPMPRTVLGDLGDWELPTFVEQMEKVLELLRETKDHGGAR